MVISALKMMGFTHSDWGQHDILNSIMMIKNEVQIQYILTFWQKIRSIPQQQYLNMQMFWIK